MLNTKKISTIVKSTPWLIQGFNGAPIYQLGSGGASILGKSDELSKKLIGKNYHHFIFSSFNNYTICGYDKRDLANIGQAYFKKNKNVRQLNRIIKIYINYFIQSVKKSNFPKIDDLKKFELEQLFFLEKNLLAELDASVSFSHTIESISFVTEKKLDDFIKKRKNISLKKFQILSSPITPSYLLESEILLYKIKIAKKPNQAKLINKFLKKFSWLKSNYAEGKILTQKEILALAKIQKFPTKINYAKIKKQKNIISRKLKLTKQEKFVLRTIEKVSAWQDSRKANILSVVSKMEMVLDIISKKIKINKNLLKRLSANEFNYAYLSNPKFIKNLKKRLPKCFYYISKRKTYTKPELYDRIKKILDQKESSDKKEIKGSTAFKGLVTGKVKIVFTLQDMPKVNFGDILVTHMTRPEFLPAMQKAAGFVTDEGGITSHAAIVSREMKKPCIIGTKIATKVLKDGDLVEVDANTGIVKLIKK